MKVETTAGTFIIERAGESYIVRSRSAQELQVVRDGLELIGGILPEEMRLEDDGLWLLPSVEVEALVAYLGHEVRNYVDYERFEPLTNP